MERTHHSISIFDRQPLRLKGSQWTGSIFKNFFYLPADNENIFKNLHPLKPLTSLYFRRAIPLPPTWKLINQLPRRRHLHYTAKTASLVCAMPCVFAGVPPAPPAATKKLILITLLRPLALFRGFVHLDLVIIFIFFCKVMFPAYF